MKQMRENFHLKIRTEYRQKEFAKKRFVQVLPTCQFYKQAVIENNIQQLLSDLDDSNTMQFISFLSSVEDHQCNHHLVGEGALVAAIQTCKELLALYGHSNKEDVKLNYLLSILGNLIDFVKFPNPDYSEIIQTSLNVSKHSSQDLLQTLTWIIDEYQQKVILPVPELKTIYQFLFENLMHWQIVSQTIDTLINVQFKQKILINDEYLHNLMRCIVDSQEEMIFCKCCCILVNMTETSRVSLSLDVIQRLSELLQRHDYLPLLKLCNIYYPELQLSKDDVLQRLALCLNNEKLEQYIQLAQRMISDQLISNDEFRKALKDMDMTNQCEDNKILVQSLLLQD